MGRTCVVLVCLCSVVGGCMVGDPPEPSIQPNRVGTSTTLAFGPEAIWAGFDVYISGCGYPKGSKSAPTTITLSASGPQTFTLTAGVDANGCLVDNMNGAPSTTIGPAGTYMVTASVTSNGGKTTVVATGSFTAIAPPSSGCNLQVATRAALPAAISYGTLVAVGGSLYSFGGVVDNSSYSAASFRYDPASDTWSSISPLPAALELPGAATDGTYVYIAGPKDRWSGTTVFRYDPATDSYTELATSTPLSGWAAQSGATVVYLAGNVYYFGGEPAEWYCTGYPHLGIFHVASNTWTDGADYPDGSYTCLTSGVAYSGAIYAGGGAGLFGGTASNKTYRYDPAANAWSDASIADQPAPRTSAASGLVGGRWMLAGGDANESVITWDPSSNRWSLAGTLTSAWGGASTVSGSTFYLLGSASSGTTGLQAVSCM
jgi:N-acetylneuraminic acid mutarotase